MLPGGKTGPGQPGAVRVRAQRRRASISSRAIHATLARSTSACSSPSSLSASWAAVILGPRPSWRSRSPVCGNRPTIMRSAVAEVTSGPPALLHHHLLLDPGQREDPDPAFGRRRVVEATDSSRRLESCSLDLRGARHACALGCVASGRRRRSMERDSDRPHDAGGAPTCHAVGLSSTQETRGR